MGREQSLGQARVIKYLGSKRVLLPAIRQAVRELQPNGTVLDLFSGTSRVGQALKQDGYQVIANDHNSYAATIARCYVQADRESWLDHAQQEIRRLQSIADACVVEGDNLGGWFTQSYCRESRYFQEANGLRIEAVRKAIQTGAYAPELEAILLVSLMEAADRVDSTAGVQMAFLKQWAPRAHHSLELRMPELWPRPAAGSCQAWHLEALEAAQSFSDGLVYLDPPYNQHSYLGNYHIWETLVRWDAPETYGIACKRTDVRERKSAFNSKPGCAIAMKEVLHALHGCALLVSFSDEGYLAREQMESLLSCHGAVETRAFGHPRYVGAKIGIHNPRGERVGKVSHVRNQEYLFLVRP